MSESTLSLVEGEGIGLAEELVNQRLRVRVRRDVVAYLADLASTARGDRGAGVVGFNTDLPYPAGSVGAAIKALFLGGAGAGGGGASLWSSIDALLVALEGRLGPAQLDPALLETIDLIDAPGTGLVDRVAGLVTTYGSTAAAATSASDAMTARVAAEQAQASASSASASAAQAAATAAGDAVAAAGHYNATVAATGGLTASVTALSTAVSGPDGLAAQHVLKVAAVRADGKKVFSSIGLAADSTSAGGQSQILLMGDSLVFVPSSNINATPQEFFTVGTVNGVTTLVVPAASIGDGTITSAKIASLNAQKIVGGSITADKFQLASGTAASVTNGGVVFSGGAVGSGGSYGYVQPAAGQGGTWTYQGFPMLGKLLGSITLPYAGQTIHATVTGYLALAFGTDWSGAAVGLHGLDVVVTLSFYKVISGNTLDSVPNGVVSTNSRDITYLDPSFERRIPFSLARGLPGFAAGEYVAFLSFNVNASEGGSSTVLRALNPAACFAPHHFHMFANGI